MIPRAKEFDSEALGGPVPVEGHQASRCAAGKVIRCRADLAINGAPPAYPEPIHVGRPNIGSREEFLARVGEMLDRQWLTNNGPLVKEFEARVADYLGVRNCVAMCNGTIALEIAIRALGLEGEVIVPSFTFVATAHALHWQGITPVFADIDPETHNLDPEAVRKMITPRTTGIIGVQLWGRPAPVAELQAIADEHGLELMFDAAHAFGCSHQGHMIGRFGRCEVLSFHATKFFNTFEGGAVVTDDDELAEQMRLMRNFGFAGYDDVIHPGINGKMTEVCAAMGLTNLDSIDEILDVNQRHYHAYQEAFVDVSCVRLVCYNDLERNNYQYIVLNIGSYETDTRDTIVRALHAEHILARKYFWPGCHKMKPYSDLFPHANLTLKQTELVTERLVVLPTGKSIPKDIHDTIAQVVKWVVST